MITEKNLNTKLRKIYTPSIRHNIVLEFLLKNNNIIYGLYSVINIYLPLAKNEITCSNTIKKLLFSENKYKIELALNLL